MQTHDITHSFASQSLYKRSSKILQKFKTENEPSKTPLVDSFLCSSSVGIVDGKRTPEKSSMHRSRDVQGSYPYSTSTIRVRGLTSSWTSRGDRRTGHVSASPGERKSSAVAAEWEVDRAAQLVGHKVQICSNSTLKTTSNIRERLFECTKIDELSSRQR